MRRALADLLSRAAAALETPADLSDRDLVELVEDLREMEALLRPSSDPNENWENNRVQFARLLSEIRAVGVPPEMYTGLSSSMDLDRDQIDEVLDRAQDEWEDVKANTPLKGNKTYSVVGVFSDTEQQFCGYYDAPSAASAAQLAMDDNPETLLIAGVLEGKVHMLSGGNDAA